MIQILYVGLCKSLKDMLNDMVADLFGLKASERVFSLAFIFHRATIHLYYGTTKSKYLASREQPTVAKILIGVNNKNSESDMGGQTTKNQESTTPRP